MALRIRHISTRFALLLGIAAVVPLVAYRAVSILSLRRGTRESVVNGNQNVAVRAAEEIRRYVVTNAELLKALAADLQDTGLTLVQQDQILKNYVLQFREFREITLFDEAGAPIVSSRAGHSRVEIPRDPPLTLAGVAMSPIRIDQDLLPTATFAIHLKHLNRPPGTRRRGIDRSARLDRHRRAADRRSVRVRDQAAAAAPDRDLARAPDDGVDRLPDRAIVHPADPAAAARHPGDRRGQPRHARADRQRRRVRPSGR